MRIRTGVSKVTDEYVWDAVVFSTVVKLYRGVVELLESGYIKSIIVDMCFHTFFACADSPQYSPLHGEQQQSHEAAVGFTDGLLNEASRRVATKSEDEGLKGID